MDILLAATRRPGFMFGLLICGVVFLAGCSNETAPAARPVAPPPRAAVESEAISLNEVVARGRRFTGGSPRCDPSHAMRTLGFDES